MSCPMPEIGSCISLISKADIRYEGFLFTVDPERCTIALARVKSYGTEDRETQFPIAPQNQYYDYILFRGTDIKDIRVINNNPVPNDPAIMQMHLPPQPPQMTMPNKLGQPAYQSQPGFMMPQMGGPQASGPPGGPMPPMGGPPPPGHGQQPQMGGGGAAVPSYNAGFGGMNNLGGMISSEHTPICNKVDPFLGGGGGVEGPSQTPSGGGVAGPMQQHMHPAVPQQQQQAEKSLNLQEKEASGARVQLLPSELFAKTGTLHHLEPKQQQQQHQDNGPNRKIAANTPSPFVSTVATPPSGGETNNHVIVSGGGDPGGIFGISVSRNDRQQKQHQQRQEVDI
ncbi:AGAP006935-PA-like protein [Anopheles sinensis]|uniref:AGAP006935-PA-like protein n=1 Tax=Anopheles sinensis TaxID=74873 RepID=A0A084W136_ANOSI|nr:AGAP006935-PA-like protein [Anopheles sinensis]